MSLSFFSTAAAPKPTVDDARKFFERANAELKTAFSNRERHAFVNLTYLTDDTDLLAAQASEEVQAVVSRLIHESEQFTALKLPDDLARQLKLLRLSVDFPSPNEPKARAELAKIGAELTSIYGKGEWCAPAYKNEKAKCYKLDQLEKLMAEERDFDRLRDAWVGWHKISVPMRDKYTREITLANAGARALGFKDVGELWRAGYDMPPDAFAAEMDRLWLQVKPLYDQLHCYVRARLSKHYGEGKVPPTGPIPTHVLGNMWAQEWGNIYPLVEPFAGEAQPDVSKTLEKKGYDAVKMVKMGEGFFTSLGFDPLPATFWTRSMLVRPRDREVVCHASAWDITGDGDLRIKMCIQPTQDDLVTVHHELGHDFYYQAYLKQPTLFQQGANDGFHEGIGDAIALSMTPEYLQKMGLYDKVVQNDKALINAQMRTALDKIAFLPFGLLLDRWRWEVFSGRIAPAQYNAAFWELKKKYQGVVPPAQRSEADFDPGAKFHIASNTPYTRYFIARIVQFQLYRALCRAAGHQGPMHTCSIYGNKAAGEKLRAMLALGASKPWPEALAVGTGERTLDASALIEYFQPLMGWLAKQNQGQRCGF